MTTTENSRADALTEAVTHTIDTISRQLDLIAERAPGNFLDKVPVVRSLTAHKKRLEKALAPVEQHEAAPAGSRYTHPGCEVCACPAGVCQADYSYPRKSEQAAPAAPLEGTGNGADVRALLTTDGYFVYDRAGGHVEFYDTDAERDAAHREAIAEYRRDAQHDQEWPPEVEGIVSGVVTHITGELNIHEDGYEFEPRAVNFHAHAPRTVVAGAVPQPIGMHDVTTSAGGRSYIAEFFAKRLFRHDFGRYINERLAADFACALAKYLMEHDTSLSADAAAAPENCAHDYVRSDRVCIECGEQPEEPAADERAAFDYDDVVSICDAHGIGLPVDCIEMVVEIVRHAAPPAQVATRQGLTDALRQAREELAQVEWENDPPARITDLFSTIDALLDGDKR
ncbi:hypothetical protein BLA17378_08634 [Burkholderia aenigmatica]|uniref:Uncharacterized protein n=1 Tax=Burkholderia aenigmatica TaxID=2015348 RepID=A0ABY6Y7H5_9BURK|nr:hypothetical protein [Burkholderia aenigmatica]VWD49760.1 hypothetical protein BLA17378_08634 [Burkholderia aenigmatica]